MSDSSGFSLRISRLRTGLKQYELGILAGIHASRLSMIETGRASPRPDELMRLRRALASVNQQELGAKGE